MAGGHPQTPGMGVPPLHLRFEPSHRETLSRLTLVVRPPLHNPLSLTVWNPPEDSCGGLELFVGRVHVKQREGADLSYHDHFFLYATGTASLFVSIAGCSTGFVRRLAIAWYSPTGWKANRSRADASSTL